MGTGKAIATLGLILALAAPAAAQLRVVGEGKQQSLDSKQFSRQQQPGYQLFAARCTKCHPMSRPISALTTGITPISNGKFDKSGIKKYVIRMMRKPNSGISRKDAKEILRFLMYARELAAKPATK